MSDHSTEREPCAICINELDHIDAQVRLGCSHTFHYTCLLRWNLQSSDDNHRSCPLCRNDIDTNLDDVLHISARSILSDPPPHRLVNPSQGTALTCQDCFSRLTYCEMCGIYVCKCVYIVNDPHWETRTIHSRPNPFGSYEPSDEPSDEIPRIYCSNCFENREGFVMDIMMEDDGDNDIFYNDHIQELYEDLFNDTSTIDNTDIYASYPTYTFVEFRHYMTDLFREELRVQFNLYEPLEPDINPSIDQPVIDWVALNELRGITGDGDPYLDQFNEEEIMESDIHPSIDQFNDPIDIIGNDDVDITVS